MNEPVYGQNALLNAMQGLPEDFVPEIPRGHVRLKRCVECQGELVIRQRGICRECGQAVCYGSQECRQQHAVKHAQAKMDRIAYNMARGGKNGKPPTGSQRRALKRAQAAAAERAAAQKAALESASAV